LSQAGLVEHVFRHEYGSLVASLLSRVGVHHVDAVEDAVQYALMQGLNFWPKNKAPTNPSAWLYKVALRKLLSEFRTNQRRHEILNQQPDLVNPASVELAPVPLSGEMSDAMLRMLFVACQQDIPLESQLVFTLKSLCGFSVKEIALRLFISEENVYKRFSRARKNLKSDPDVLDALTESDMIIRLPAVHAVVYLLFTEGYLSSHSDTAIRQDLCEEAIRLALMLLQSAIGKVPETCALLALMYFHLARLNGRQDETGALLLLEQQDRSRWNQTHMRQALQYLQQSAQGEHLSRYHVEANIAAQHGLAPSFSETPWENITESYELLERIAPSPLHRLNRAVAVAQWQGPKAGLQVLQDMELPKWLNRSYYWHAVQADLQYQSGEGELAKRSAQQAMQAAPTDTIKQLLQRRFKKWSLD